MNNFLTKFLLLLALGFLSWSTLDAQRNGDADKRRQGQGFIGLNAGGAWQQADIRASGGGGLGFYIGSNIYYKPTSFFSFDWRFRYLFTATSSKDIKATQLSSFHPLGGGASRSPFNGFSPIDENLHYNNPSAGGKGYAYLNNKTFFNDLSIEFRLNFEKLRQKTNIWFSIYGGGGLGIYNTYTDQATGNIVTGALYNYEAIDANGSASSVLTQLNTMRDRDYETDMTDLRARYMSNIGFELGYWFTPNFAVGIGHRLTFTHTDLFDGEYSQVRTGKDLHHYANLFTHWNFGRSSARATVMAQPVITSISHRCGQSIESYSGTFKYKVTNVMDASQIIIKVNGSETKNFSYNRKTQEVTLITTFRGGENDIAIFANNGNSSNSLNCTIFAGSTNNPVITNPNPPVINNPTPPVITPTVRITAPANNSTFTNCNTNVSAIVTNAETVYIVVNGQRISTASNNTNASFNVNLNRGANTIVVHAINKGNEQTNSITVYCNEPQQVTPVAPVVKRPTVKFTLPVGNPFNTNNAQIDLTAVTTNIDFRSQITVNINGSNTSNFQFTNQNTVTINNVNLNPGNNTISINVSNNDGSDTDSKIVVYNVPRPVNPPTIVNPPVVVNRTPPTVRFTAPNGNPYTSTANTISLTAATTNITNQSQISVSVNNRNHTNFAFNASRNTVTINNVSLNEGNNTVNITVRNNDGNDADSKLIVYNAPRKVTPPTVQFTAPNGNPYTSTANTVSLTAATTNITNQSQVSVTVNNSAHSDFFFNAGRNTVAINNVSLNNGNNTVSITVRNEDGQASDNKVVVYNAPRPANPPALVTPTTPPVVSRALPIVEFTAPNGNPYTSTANTVSLTAATTNITNQSQVSVTVNNRAHSDFFFNAGRNTVAINNVSLNEGNNNVVITVRNNDGQASDDKVIVYTAPRQVAPPTVQFTTPNVNPFTATSNVVNIAATTTNISAQNQITITVNNAPYTNFTFNGSRNSVLINSISLNEGNNNVVITVRNEDGQASDSKVVIYNAPRQATPPTVQFTAPNGNPYSSTANTVNLTAATTNITAQNQITLTVNNRAYTNFSFNASNNTVTINNVSLNEGNNTVNISVRNEDGQASDSKVITYTAPRQVAPPTVQFTVPTGNPYSAPSQTLTLTAATTNITDRSQVSVTVAGRPYTNFAYANNTVTINNVSLAQGETAVSITVQNEDGQASDNKTIIYKQVAPPPTVRITTPSANPHVISTNSQTIVAVTTNAVNRNTITFRLNGVAITDFEFANEVVTATNLPMQEGNNNIDITVDNGVGSATASTVVRVELPRAQAPIISNMNATQAQSRSGISVQVSARIEHHTSTNGVTFTANGTPVTNFTLSNGYFTAQNVPFQEGYNVYTISIDGEGGRAAMSCTLNQNAGNTDNSGSGNAGGNPNRDGATSGGNLPTTGGSRGGSDNSNNSGNTSGDGSGSMNRTTVTPTPSTPSVTPSTRPSTNTTPVTPTPSTPSVTPSTRPSTNTTPVTPSRTTPSTPSVTPSTRPSTNTTPVTPSRTTPSTPSVTPSTRPSTNTTPVTPARTTPSTPSVTTPSTTRTNTNTTPARTTPSTPSVTAPSTRTNTNTTPATPARTTPSTNKAATPTKPAETPKQTPSKADKMGKPTPTETPKETPSKADKMGKPSKAE